MTAKEYLDPLDQMYAVAKNDVDAKAMEKYMKGLYEYYGIKSAPRREIQSKFLKAHGLPDEQSFRDICIEGMDWPKREMHYFCMELPFKMKNHFGVDDHQFIEAMVRQNSWWDTVDYIASTIAGFYFQKYPEMIDQIIPIWRDDKDMWVNRTAILFQLKYRNNTDFELLKNVIDPHRVSNEFFHQKAIGWALRQYAKFQPDLVLEYVNATELKPLSRREALKHF